MRYVKYNWLLLSLLLWAACKKDDSPDPIDGDPVFTAQFEVDSAARLIEAGVEDVYLFTDYRVDDTEVLISNGSFAQADCPAGNCPGSLTFEFRNDEPATQVVVPGSLFAVGNRAYTLESQFDENAIYRVTFSTDDTLEYSQFRWRVDSGMVITGKSFTQDFEDNATHNLSLSAFQGGALKSVVNRTFSPNGGGDHFSEVTIEVIDSSLYARAIGSVALSYEWNTGETTQQIVAFNNAPFYSVTVTGNAGITAVARVNNYISGDQEYETADFQLSVQEIIPDTLQLGRVNIRWVDENGLAWESQKGEQNTDAQFQVLSSEPYEANENGQKTWKMTVSYSCRVFNTSNPAESKTLNGTAVLAVAYP